MWEVLIKAADLFDGAGPAIAFVLLLVAAGFGYLYHLERKENKRLHDQMREDSREMVQALIASKASSDATREALNALASRI
jgi:hypothetical protein